MEEVLYKQTKIPAESGGMKPDISILLKTGHFHFALTGAIRGIDIYNGIGYHHFLIKFKLF
jgi:hypothetical protein